MNAMYTAEATSVGGRSGNVKTPDGIINFEVRPPHEMGGPNGNYTNPEQLFAAGYAACFGSALSHLALAKKIRIKPVVTCKVSIGKKESGEGYMLAAVMEIAIPDMDYDQALALANEAHQVCPYSNATRNNMEVEIRIVDKKQD